MPSILSVVTYGLWLAGSSSTSSLGFGRNTTLFRRDNINKYGGCDKEYINPNGDGKVTGRELIDLGYQGALRLAQHINPFLIFVDPDGQDPIELDPGTLETRYFGDFDSLPSGRRLIGDGSSLDAYTVDAKDKHIIVFCAPYFAAKSLDKKKQDLEELPSHNRDITYMKNSALLFLHEMTHLSVIEGRSPQPDYDEISALEAIAFSAGEYTPNGWLKGKNLRIFPLGDSITYGYKSSDGNGYRKTLRDLLVKAGNTVDMIGSARAGIMDDNDNEGHSGYIISQVAEYNSAYKQRPNVLLLHAGTNDMGQATGSDTAPERLDSLVGALVAALPDAAVVAARIIPAASSATESRIRVYNNAITKLMSARARKGQHIMMVACRYNKMAIKWAIALTAADHLGWIKAPVAGEGGPNRDTCKQDPTWLPQGEIATGAGLSANLFVKSACLTNPVSKTCDCKKLNTPSALTQELLDSTDECERRALNTTLDTAVHFADLNGDGRYEYLWVDNNGAVTAFLNLGSSSGGANAVSNAGRMQADQNNGPNAAKVTWIPQGTIASGVGVGRDSFVFADINGDGRSDYIALSQEDGRARLWLNGDGPDDGPNAAKVVWLPHGKIPDGVGNSGRDVQFTDLNGDSRAEYLDVKLDTSRCEAPLVPLSFAVKWDIA
ncbi:SGNH hydrolase [Fusarium acutatum]|uniref:SGNH hydrolase n=1 Tax=Fusarium acutatum TaxID=78861 RepID=A0A8H4NNY9_9HYPO|nr:SGNH hydrolase [Fusarium acutatum]